MGECPSWYSFLRAAKYLGVPPWDLLEKPKAWVALALDAESAEAYAEEQHTNRAQRRANQGKGRGA